MCTMPKRTLRTSGEKAELWALWRGAVAGHTTHPHHWHLLNCTSHDDLLVV